MFNRVLNKTLRVLDGVRNQYQAWRYPAYFANDLSNAINGEGLRRMQKARTAARMPIDPGLRGNYERDQYSRMAGVRFDSILFEGIRKKAIAALEDPVISPCAYLHGKQAERQGIPRSVITHDVRRYTSDVGAVLPEAASLLNPEIVNAIRSCIGSNFVLESVVLTRNFHVEPEINNKYELLSERWHFDHQYTDGFSLFVCLSDVTIADGPTHVVSAFDSRRLLAKGFDADIRKNMPTGGLAERDFEDMPSFWRLAGPPATMLLCHTSFCLHRAGMPERNRMRDLLIFSFRPSAVMDLTWPRPQDRFPWQ